MKLSSALFLLAAVTSAVAGTELCCTAEFDDSDAEYEGLFGEAVALNLITPEEAPYNFVTGCFAKQKVCFASIPGSPGSESWTRAYKETYDDEKAGAVLKKAIPMPKLVSRPPPHFWMTFPCSTQTTKRHLLVQSFLREWLGTSWPSWCSIERLFSRSRHLCHEVRGSMKAETIVKAMLMKMWIKARYLEY
ncbi:hypothetical protein B0H19DRAFT_1078089 [Mycena capillaripes]|nr:hypothetical protein B0H19DRAFT_1078089 [Mycena capillaripes]